MFFRKFLASFFLFALAAGSAAVAGSKHFSYLVQGITTSPSGKYQMAVYRDDAGGEEPYGYYFVKLNQQGALELASEQVPGYAGEQMDERGYGLTSVYWSQKYPESGGHEMGEVAAVEFTSRKTNWIFFYHRQGESFRKMDFESDSLEAQALNVAKTEFAKLGFGEERAELARNFVNFGLYYLGENNDQPLLNNSPFDQGEEIVGRYAANYYAWPKNGGEGVDGNVEIQVGLKYVNGQMQVRPISATFSRE